MKREHDLAVGWQARLEHILNSSGAFLPIGNPDPRTHPLDVRIDRLRGHSERKQQYAGRGLVSDTANGRKVRARLGYRQSGQCVKIGTPKFPQRGLNGGCLLSGQSGKSDGIGNIVQLRIFDRCPGWETVRVNRRMPVPSSRPSCAAKESSIPVHPLDRLSARCEADRTARRASPNHIDLLADSFRYRAWMLHAPIVRESISPIDCCHAIGIASDSPIALYAGKGELFDLSGVVNNPGASSRQWGPAWLATRSSVDSVAFIEPALSRAKPCSGSGDLRREPM